MSRYLLRRLLQAVPVLLIVSIVVFGLMRLIPGDPAAVLMGMDATKAQLDAARAAWGMDKPLYVQYVYWLANLLRGDFGMSYFSHIPVSTLIVQKLPATVELTILSLTIALLIAVPVGILAAVRHGSWLDRLATTSVTIGLSFPDFFLGILLILLFAVVLRWLPPTGYAPLATDPAGNLRYVLLPALTLGLILAAPTMRFLRAGMLDVLYEDYIRVARSKGLAERLVIWRHALKNAAIPTVTLVGVQLGSLLGGTAIVETVFSWPGIGWLAVKAVYDRDYAVIQAIVMMVAFFFVVINLAVDIVYGLLNPRIRYQ